LRLFVQIPCWNERETIASVLRELPRKVPGFRTIEVVVIDDGSTDGTADVARSLGVHHIVRFTRHRGLAAAHMAGLDACLRLGADVVVNTDADHQYPGAAIAELTRPILEGRADIVVGDRQTDTVAHFSVIKKLLQRVGSSVVRRVSRTRVADSTSGFRAMNRAVLEHAYVHNRFTYTLETIIQAGQAGLCVENVTIKTNPTKRASRLVPSTADYVVRNGGVILRAFHTYSPVRTFGWISFVFLAVGVALGGRFLYFFVRSPSPTGHVQSLLVGVGALVMAIVIATMMLLSELIATNRRLLEEVLARTRRVERAVLSRGSQPEGIESTGALPWSDGSGEPTTSALRE
jgi:glycosyltransferase involved in cell wall biosynthesis